MSDKEELHNEIRKALGLLNAGRLVAFPTETGWAIGCDATNVDGLKELDQFGKKELILSVDNISRINNYLVEFPDIVWDLFELAETPLVLIIPGLKNLPYRLVQANDSIGFMVAKEGFSNMLAQRFRKPIAIIPIEKDFLKSVDLDEVYVIQTANETVIKKTKPSIIKFGKGNVFKIIRG